MSQSLLVKVEIRFSRVLRCFSGFVEALRVKVVRRGFVLEEVPQGHASLCQQ